MIERKSTRARRKRRNPATSVFRTMTPHYSRETRAIAYEAALAVIG